MINNYRIKILVVLFFINTISPVLGGFRRGREGELNYLKKELSSDFSTTKNFKFENDNTQDPHIIIVGVPGLGSDSYEALDRYVFYLRTKFPTICDPASKTNYNDIFISGYPIAISSSPGFNSKISAYNYFKDKDFIEFYNNKNPQDKKPPLIVELPDNKQNTALFERYKKICYPNNLKPDLGQANCQKCFIESAEKQLNEVKNDTVKTIFHANSQGTATTLNYIANLVKNNKYNAKTNSFTIGKKEMVVEAIILEAPVATSVSAVVHSVENVMPVRLKGVVSFLQKSKNFLASAFPAYNRLLQYFMPQPQMQPIDSIKIIPHSIPIIIAHNTRDGTTPFAGAKALYYACTLQGRKNCYFIPFKKENLHSELFNNYNLDESDKDHKRNDLLEFFDSQLTLKEFLFTLQKLTDLKDQKFYKYIGPLENDSEPVEKFLNGTWDQNKMYLNNILESIPYIYKAVKPNDTETYNKLVELYGKAFKPTNDTFGKEEYEKIIKTRTI